MAQEHRDKATRAHLGIAQHLEVVVAREQRVRLERALEEPEVVLIQLGDQ